MQKTLTAKKVLWSLYIALIWIIHNDTSKFLVINNGSVDISISKAQLAATLVVFVWYFIVALFCICVVSSGEPNKKLSNRKIVWIVYLGGFIGLCVGWLISVIISKDSMLNISVKMLIPFAIISVISILLDLCFRIHKKLKTEE